MYLKQYLVKLAIYAIPFALLGGGFLVAGQEPDAGGEEEGPMGILSTTGLAFTVLPVSSTPCAEPTVGVTALNNIFFRCNTPTFRSTNNGTSWSVVRNSPVNFDPMLWVDPVSSRIFVSDLSIACNTLVWSDNEGVTWQPTQTPGHPAACGTPVNDHQKIVSGAWRPGSPLNVGAHSRAVYYCFNGVAYSGCSLSPDGGLAWAPAVPVTALVGVGISPVLKAACGGLHGHPHISDDGSIFLPNKSCGSGNFATWMVSVDQGLTWFPRMVGGVLSDGENDPDIDSTPNGRVWMTFIARTSVGATVQNIPYVAFSDNKGGAFTVMPVGLGTHTINTATFPAITAGDNGRVAVGWLGTSAVGGNGGAGGVPATAVWHAYIAVTHDNGANWETIQVSSDPVQRGTICMDGINCGADRNLLDFNDMTHDQYGTVIMAYADGCTSATCVGAGGTAASSRSAEGRIARQSGGDTLLSAWDPVFN